jgi:hypothetical protein
MRCSRRWPTRAGGNCSTGCARRTGKKLHYLNPVPIHEIAERWIGKFERSRLQALSDMKQALETGDE